MVDISRKTYERNAIETVVDNDRMLWLNEKHNKGLNHKNLQEITTIIWVTENTDMNQKTNHKNKPTQFLYTTNLQPK